MTRLFSIAAPTAALLLAAAPAVAAPTPTSDVSISHRDLDLNDPDDLARLDRRIRRAARDYCQGTGTRIPSGRCETEFVTMARGQVAARTGARGD